MNQFHTEYDASTTSPRPCYSNLDNYGAHGKVRKIVPPTPGALQPWMFNLMKPHQMTQQAVPPEKPSNCGPYRTLAQTCAHNCPKH